MKTAQIRPTVCQTCLFFQGSNLLKSVFSLRPSWRHAFSTVFLQSNHLWFPKGGASRRVPPRSRRSRPAPPRFPPFLPRSGPSPAAFPNRTCRSRSVPATFPPLLPRSRPIPALFPPRSRTEYDFTTPYYTVYSLYLLSCCPILYIIIMLYHNIPNYIILYYTYIYNPILYCTLYYTVLFYTLL